MAEKLLVLKKIGLFAALPPAALQGLANQGRWRELRKGDVLFQKDDVLQGTLVVHTGRVKLTRTTAAGAEAVTEVVTGPGLILNSLPFYTRHSGGAEALDDKTCLLYLPLQALQQALMASPQAYQALVADMAQRLQKQEGEIEHLMVQNTTQRLGCYLLQLCRKQGHNAQTITLDLEKATIASRLGMQPETLSRAMAHLKKDLGVQVEGNLVTLPNVQALADYVCQHCSHLYPCKTTIF